MRVYEVYDFLLMEVSSVIYYGIPPDPEGHVPGHWAFWWPVEGALQTALNVIAGSLMMRLKQSMSSLGISHCNFTWYTPVVLWSPRQQSMQTSRSRKLPRLVSSISPRASTVVFRVLLKELNRIRHNVDGNSV